MTLAQARIFSEAADRERRRKNRDMLFMLRGAQYDKAEFEKLLKALGD